MLPDHDEWMQVAVEIWNRTDQAQRNAFIIASPFWERQAILELLVALHAEGVDVPLGGDLDRAVDEVARRARGPRDIN